MNFVRGLITFFMAILLFLTAAGFSWSAGLPSPRKEGSRAALLASALAGIVCLTTVWGHREKTSR